MSQQKLAQEIVSRSEATTWEVAKNEWELSEIYRAQEPETCLCGHHPILELCVLRNKKNGQDATVGNHCVHKFMGLGSERIFAGFRRVRDDTTRALGAEALFYGFQHGWINDWEYEFYCDTRRKRKLSERQLAKRIQINEKFLARLQR